MNAPALKSILAGTPPADVGTPKSDLPEFIPADSPFSEEQRSFLNGLFAGVYAIAQNSGGDASPAAQTPLKVFFGSQTGTAESVSKDLRKYAGTMGFGAEIAELDTIAPADLTDLQHVLIVAATHGEGEPTDNAHKFHTALMDDGAPQLPASVNFSVCGLGDSSYPHFNQVARDFDARLEALGATRAAPLVTCDVDYDADYESWRKAVFEAPAFAEMAGTGAPAAPAEEDVSAPAFDKNHPFLATLMSSASLSGEGSAKTVNHIEISLTGGGEDVQYEVGDALGIWPLNDPAEVESLLQVARMSGAEVVEVKGSRTTLRQALYRSLDLAVITPKTAELWNVDVADDAQVIDVLAMRAQPLDPQALVDGLRSLQPRLYSISSSPKKHPGEVHLTVGEVHYELHGSPRKGVASTFLGSRLAEGAALGVYVQKASHFYLPDDPNTPLIMIGPGTGIAPFRAFLEEREVQGARGKNWLFFGDQHEACDYLYADQINSWLSSGLLSKLDLAWSRDSAEKVYVQHLIEKEGAEFFKWLEDGAAIYVCGDATRMASDVENAILSLIAKHADTNEDGAQAYLEKLRGEHRYQRDVY
ncbi:MAG: flavodoxin domain-containing protein [Pseudomonadota bacterium]